MLTRGDELSPRGFAREQTDSVVGVSAGALGETLAEVPRHALTGDVRGFSLGSRRNHFEQPSAIGRPLMPAGFLVSGDPQLSRADLPGQDLAQLMYVNCVLEIRRESVPYRASRRLPSGASVLRAARWHARSGTVESLHHSVNSRVQDVSFALYRDFPDEQRVRGEEKF